MILHWFNLFLNFSNTSSPGIVCTWPVSISATLLSASIAQSLSISSCKGFRLFRSFSINWALNSTGREIASLINSFSVRIEMPFDWSCQSKRYKLSLSYRSQRGNSRRISIVVRATKLKPRISLMNTDFYLPRRTISKIPTTRESIARAANSRGFTQMAVAQTSISHFDSRFGIRCASVLSVIFKVLNLGVKEVRSQPLF